MLKQCGQLFAHLMVPRFTPDEHFFFSSVKFQILLLLTQTFKFDSFEFHFLDFYLSQSIVSNPNSIPPACPLHLHENLLSQNQNYIPLSFSLYPKLNTGSTCAPPYPRSLIDMDMAVCVQTMLLNWLLRRSPYRPRWYGDSKRSLEQSSRSLAPPSVTKKTDTVEQIGSCSFYRYWLI